MSSFTLQAPEALQPYFGQPGVATQELLKHGVSIDAIAKACVDGEGMDDSCGLLYPVDAVWVMGFSWSSAVAQGTTLSVCISAGIAEGNILSLDHDVPVQQEELCLVATDDTVLLHTNSEHLGSKPASACSLHGTNLPAAALAERLVSRVCLGSAVELC